MAPKKDEVIKVLGATYRFRYLPDLVQVFNMDNELVFQSSTKEEALQFLGNDAS